jgi:putative membrane protein insertion efficiency factor
VKYPAIALVYLYRYTVGLFLRPSCKYYPSCSSYAIGVLERYGFVRGTLLAGWRLLRCNPWSAGGVDLPEDARLFGRPCGHAHKGQLA